MNRRSVLRASFAGTAILPTTTLAQTNNTQTGGRELVVQSVHEALVRSTTLQIHSGLQSLPVDDPLFTEIAGDSPTIKVWDDWNDHVLNQVFGVFTVYGPDSPLGAYRIFDTPDISHSVHQPVVDEIEQGYLNVGGVRASWMDAGGIGFASMRLWNVLITGVGETQRETEDV